MKNTLTLEQIIELRAMIGQRLAFIAGPNLSSDLSSDFVIIATDTDLFGLQGDVHQDILEGFPELYSSIETCTVEKHDLEEARTHGYQYYFKKGECISEILLVRENIECFIDGKQAWLYTSDIGIVLKLESGCVAITRLGYHDEMLQVTYIGELNMDYLPPTSGRFENDLHSNYAFTRSLIKI